MLHKQCRHHWVLLQQDSELNNLIHLRQSEESHDHRLHKRYCWHWILDQLDMLLSKLSHQRKSKMLKHHRLHKYHCQNWDLHQGDSVRGTLFPMRKSDNLVNSSRNESQICRLEKKVLFVLEVLCRFIR